MAIGVANLAFSVYTEYGKIAIAPKTVRNHWRDVVKRLSEIEKGEKAGSVDAIVQLRSEINRLKLNHFNK